MNATSITITGYTAAAPELRVTPNGKATVSMRVAVTDRYRGAGGDWTDGATSWHSVVAWGPLAEQIAASVGKGERVVVVGRLAQREYQSEQGEKRSTWELTAEDVGISLRTGAQGGASATWEPAAV